MARRSYLLLLTICLCLRHGFVSAASEFEGRAPEHKIASLDHLPASIQAPLDATMGEIFSLEELTAVVDRLKAFVPVNMLLETHTPFDDDTLLGAKIELALLHTRGKMTLPDHGIFNADVLPKRIKMLHQILDHTPLEDLRSSKAGAILQSLLDGKKFEPSD